MITSKDLKPIIVYLAVFLIGCLLAPNVYVWGKNDRNCWITWSNYINHFGVQNIYKLEVDYPPLWHYFLWLFGKYNPTPENIYTKIYHLKHLVLFVEVLSAYAIFRVLKTHHIKNAALLPFFMLGNIAFWYNNFLFGQMDGVHTAFAFISISLALYHKPALSLIFYVLCINFKFQGIIFFPIIGIILFNEIKSYSAKKILMALLPAIFLQTLIFLPFIISGDMNLALHSFTDSVGRYPYVNMGAYNIWWLFFKKPQLVHDSIGVFNFSYNSYGLMAFFGLSGLVLLPFGLKSIGLFRKYIDVEISFQNTLLVCVLIILFFFYFNTQMHSRYSHPIVLFSGALAMLRKDYLRFFLVSLGIFLNMEGASKILKGDIAEFEIFWFQPWFVSLIFLAIILLYAYDYVFLLKNSIKYGISPKSTLS
jgi:Gpi18-like mannosyltransferase